MVFINLIRYYALVLKHKLLQQFAGNFFFAAIVIYSDLLRSCNGFSLKVAIKNADAP